MNNPPKTIQTVGELKESSWQSLSVKEEKSVYQPVLDWFAEGNTLDMTDNKSRQEYENSLDKAPDCNQ